MSSLLDDTIADLLSGRVKHKGNGLKRAAKITRYAPEVMVKISGNAKGHSHVKSHLEYISRNGQIPLEDENGDDVKGREAVSELSHDWLSDNGSHRKNSRLQNFVYH